MRNVSDVRPAAGRDGYFSVAEAAARLGVSRVSIWRWIRDGRLPAARLGHRTTRIHQSDLDQILVPNAGTRGPAWGSVATPERQPPGEAFAPRADWWAVHSSEHLVQFYDSDAFLLDAVGDFIGSALRGGDAALVVATPEHRQALLASLSAHGLNLHQAQASGQLVCLDAAATLAAFMVDGMPEPARFARALGGVVRRALQDGSRLRIFGEMVALLAIDGNDAAAVALERLWNDLQHQAAFSLMCGYPMQRLGGEPQAHFVSAVCREHSRVVPAESYTSLDDTDDRLRAIALLQQKARSLELEIAERERTEQALRRSDAELRDFLEQGLLGLHWVAADGTILWANQAEMDLLGYTTEDYIGHRIDEFYVDQDVIADVLSRLAKHEAVREREVRLRGKDGTIRHVLVSSNVLWDGDTFVHTRCFTVDITRRKIAEQRLAVQYAVTRVLAESDTLAEAAAPILASVCETLDWEAAGMWLVDADARVLRCQQFWRSPNLDLGEFEADSRSRALAPGVGLPGRVWLTKQPAWIPDVLKDDNFPRAAQAASAGLHGAFAFPVRAGEAVLGVMDFFSGEVRKPDEDVLALMDAVGGQIGQFIERKRAEAAADLDRLRLQEAFRRAPAAVALLSGPEHIFASANPLYLETVGARDADDLLGRGVREALPELVSQGYVELLDQVYRTGQPFVGREVRVLLNPGPQGGTRECFFNLVLQPTLDADGILAHAVEVTEQVRARQQVEDLARQLREQLDSHMRLNAELREVAEARDGAVSELQKLLRTRDEFLSSAAHDLKNPLANMKAQAQLLHRRVSRAGSVGVEQVLAGLESIDASTTRMAALVDDLLDAARVELGQPIELRRRPTNLVALAQGVVAEVQRAAERHHIRVETASPAVRGDWDPERLDRVLTNLLDNAVKYSPAGGEIQVRISLDEGCAVLEVRDHGLGIPAADLPYIFERFRRGGNVAGRIGGTGIGLAGVRSLIESHGGTVAVQSREGQGSTFTVRLPLGSWVDPRASTGLGPG